MAVTGGTYVAGCDTYLATTVYPKWTEGSFSPSPLITRIGGVSGWEGLGVLSGWGFSVAGRALNGWIKGGGEELLVGQGRG
jgi:hypothetical protein